MARLISIFTVALVCVLVFAQASPVPDDKPAEDAAQSTKDTVDKTYDDIKKGVQSTLDKLAKNAPSSEQVVDFAKEWIAKASEGLKTVSEKVQSQFDQAVPKTDKS